MKAQALQALQHVRTTLAYQLTPEAVSELLEPIRKALEAEPQDFSATQMRDGYKLWLWRNGDHYLAFTHLYPCFTPGGDPVTLGEPAGVAIFRESHDRATKASTAGCIDCGLVYGECKCMFPNPSQPDKVTAYREDGMFCVTYRSASIQKAKGAHEQMKRALDPSAPLTDERIDYIADLIVKGMPEGIRGFCVQWGWRQFARAIIEDCRSVL